MELSELVATHLDHARNRTLELLEPFDDADLCRQVSPLMSPLVWDLAHIGNYEELWLVRELGKRGAIDERYDDLYDAFAHPRRERAELSTLGPRDARAYVREVRERARGARRRRSHQRRSLAEEWLRVRHGDPARAPTRRDPPGHDSAHEDRLPARDRQQSRSARRSGRRRARAAWWHVRHGYRRRAMGV